MKVLGFKKWTEKSKKVTLGFPDEFDAYVQYGKPLKDAKEVRAYVQYVLNRKTNKWWVSNHSGKEIATGTGYDTLMKHANKNFNTEVTSMKSNSKKATKKATNRKAHAKASSKKKVVTKRDGNYREGSVTAIIFGKLKGGAKKKMNDLSKGVPKADQKHIPYVLRRLNRHSKSLGMKFIKHDDGSFQMKKAS